MPRKDWFYVPLPLVMAKALDEIIQKEGKRYGIGDRSELIRIIIGEFIMKYDQKNVHVKHVLQNLTDRILRDRMKDKDKQDNRTA